MSKRLPFRFNSVRTKFLAGSFVAILASAVATYFLLARTVERQSLSSLRGNTVSLAENTALQAAPLIAFESFNEMKKLLELLRADPDFAYARITDDQDRVLAEINGKQALRQAHVPQTVTQIEGDVIHIFTPVVDNGKVWGYFHLGVTLARFHAAMNRIRVFALITILALAGLSLFGLQWLVELMIARPMARLGDATKVLAGGAFPEPLAVRTHDEMGALIQQFNHMVSELRSVAAVKQQLLESMEESTRNALAASQMKSEFLANMSHEIRTPLNGMLGMVSLLLDLTDLTEQQKDFAETAKASAESLLAIINDILDFSKIEAGKLVFDDIDFDVIGTVETAIGMIADRGHRKGLEIAILVEEDVPAVLRGDPGRLRQVLLNIAGNAVKFTETGEVVIRVARKGETSTHIGVTFTVRDTGIGIPDSVKPRLFSAFTQADGSMTRKYGGTGLGLAISKQLVEMMGGSIELDSKPGIGSTFSFTVWLHRPSGEALPAEGQAPNLSGLRVLIVDDHETNRRIVRHYVESWGVQAAEVSGAAQALRLLRAHASAGNPFDIAVIDAQMPEMDGYELARRIHGNPAFSHTRVVMLSSLISHPGRTELREIGILQVLTKPVRRRQLYESLAQAITHATPAPAEQPQVKTIAASSNGGAPATAAAAAKGRILVVEDNPINQKVTMLMLQKMGYAGEVAADGLGALRATAERTYDAVLMDCQMPQMDGYEATREIRKRETGSRIPIIAMTAGAMREDQERCRAAGMDDYISKPVQQSMLAEVLKKWLAPTAP